LEKKAERSLKEMQDIEILALIMQENKQRASVTLEQVQVMRKRKMEVEVKRQQKEDEEMIKSIFEEKRRKIRRIEQ
jgi:hypothetical protein